MFSSETYVSRRSRLKKQVKSGIVLLFGNEEVGMNFAHNVYHFRQDSSFLYFFGLDIPGLAGVIDIDNDEEVVFGDELSIDDVVWTGPLPTLEEQGNSTGVKKIRPKRDLEKVISEAAKSGRKVHFLPPYRQLNTLRLADYLGVNQAAIHTGASASLINAVVEQREIKTAEEIEEMERAVRLTCKMHLTAMNITRPRISEAEVVGAIHGLTLMEDCQLSFPIILTMRGEVLHNHYHGNTLEEGQMVLCDAGAESKMHYAGDMTRTFPVGATFTPKQRDIYQIVLDAQEAAINALKPGKSFKDVHLLASKTLVEGFKGVGLMKGNADDAVQAGAHAMFFQCGLGHQMGLDVHDMEDLGEEYVGYGGKPKSTQFGLKSLRLGKELQEGYVVTVEPGAYFIPTLMDLWKKENKFQEFINYDKLYEYKDFGGIRIEDDFLITKSGSRLLGDPLPKTVSDVEMVREHGLEVFSQASM